MSGLEEPDHMSRSQSSLGLPHIMLDWTQVQLPPRFDEIDRIVQPILFDSSVSRPYQDLDGTIPVMPDIQYIHPSRCPLAVTRASISDHPQIARLNTAHDSTRDLRKWHGP
jgi:hypothetical protein